MSNLQRHEEIPAICQNEECDWFGSFEMYCVDDILEDDDKIGYVLCGDCKRKIIVDEINI